MTLKEKFAYMATGKPYNDLDPLLIEARNKATEDTNKLNAENDPAKKEELIRKLFGSAGKKHHLLIQISVVNLGKIFMLVIIFMPIMTA